MDRRICRKCFEYFAEKSKIFNFDNFSSILAYGTSGENLILLCLEDFRENLGFRYCSPYGISLFIPRGKGFRILILGFGERNEAYNHA